MNLCHGRRRLALGEEEEQQAMTDLEGKSRAPGALQVSAMYLAES